MLWLEIVIALGLAVVLGNVISRRSRIAQPLVLLALGLLLSLIPAARGVGLPSEVVLILFLPVLLFSETFTLSERELRRSLRGILLNGTIMVVFTAATIALVGHLCGLSWGTALIIGAALAPTDATALAALGGNLPRRMAQVLKAESLINDGTALVVFALGLEVATGEGHLTFGHVAELFGLSFAGAVVVGAVTGLVARRALAFFREPMPANVFLVLVPFVTYALAELVEASGVLAVVVCGLIMTRGLAMSGGAAIRSVGVPFWGLLTFVLNGVLFVLVGLQLPDALGALGAAGVWSGIGIIVAVFLASVLGRFVCIHLEIFAIRAIDRRPQQRLRRTSFGGRMVSTMAGLRGGVSLAIALSVPLVLGSEPFPGRDMIVLVTAGVVLLSLTVQGLALGSVIRWSGIADTADTEFDEESRLAWQKAGEAAREATPRLAEELDVEPEVVEAVHRVDAELHQKYNGDGDTQEQVVDRWKQEQRLRVGIIGVKRDTVVGLRNAQTIDSHVAGDILLRLDQEEMRLLGPIEME